MASTNDIEVWVGLQRKLGVGVFGSAGRPWLQSMTPDKLAAALKPYLPKENSSSIAVGRQLSPAFSRSSRVVRGSKSTGSNRTLPQLPRPFCDNHTLDHAANTHVVARSGLRLPPRTACRVTRCARSFVRAARIGANVSGHRRRKASRKCALYRNPFLAGHTSSWRHAGPSICTARRLPPRMLVQGLEQNAEATVRSAINHSCVCEWRLRPPRRAYVDAALSVPHVLLGTGLLLRHRYLNAESDRGQNTLPRDHSRESHKVQAAPGAVAQVYENRHSFPTSEFPDHPAHDERLAFSFFWARVHGTRTRKGVSGRESGCDGVSYPSVCVASSSRCFRRGRNRTSRRGVSASDHALVRGRGEGVSDARAAVDSGQFEPRRTMSVDLRHLPGLR